MLVLFCLAKTFTALLKWLWMEGLINRFWIWCRFFQWRISSSHLVKSGRRRMFLISVLHLFMEIIWRSWMFIMPIGREWRRKWRLEKWMEMFSGATIIISIQDPWKQLQRFVNSWLDTVISWVLLILWYWNGTVNVELWRRTESSSEVFDCWDVCPTCKEGDRSGEEQSSWIQNSNRQQNCFNSSCFRPLSEETVSWSDCVYYILINSGLWFPLWIGIGLYNQGLLSWSYCYWTQLDLWIGSRMVCTKVWLI